MPPASRGELALQLLKVHSVPLTILIAAIFTNRPKRGKVNGALCGVAFLLCAAWCVFVTTAWQGFPVPVSAIGDSSVASFMADRASNTLFLIAGVLAYLSGTKTGDPSEAQSAKPAKV